MILHFLVDASLPRAIADVLRAAGHQATDVRDVGLGAADDGTIAEHARQAGMCLISRDGGFGDIRAYPPRDYSGIVIVDAPYRAGRQLLVDLVERLVRIPGLAEELPGRLAVADLVRVRIR